MQSKRFDSDRRLITLGLAFLREQKTVSIRQIVVFYSLEPVGSVG
jgi:hypothetical protein